MKAKIIATVAICALIVSLFYIFSSWISTKQKDSLLAEAQAAVAKERGFAKAVMSSNSQLLKQADILKADLEALQKIGAKPVFATKIVTVEKTVTVPAEGTIVLKNGTVETVTIPCELKLSARAEIVASVGVDKQVYWKGVIDLYNRGEFLVRLEPDFSKSRMDFSKELFKKKRIHWGWQVGAGVTYDPVDRLARPAVYLGWGMTF